MKRGDFVSVAVSGDFGKPRPALVIQSDFFQNTQTVTVLLITSTLVNAPLLRVEVMPDENNGLEKPSHIMIDKPMTLKREKVGQVFGVADDRLMLAVSRGLAVFLGIA